MKKIALIASLLSVSAFAAGPHWDYSEVAKWGDLAEDYKTCKLGANQSPIDIKTTATEKASLSPIKTSYKAVTGEVVNNGHTIQVNLKDAGSAAVPSGSYNLLQFHFHTPSEEKINGANYPMVAHLVHKNEAGNLAVIAVLFKEVHRVPFQVHGFGAWPDACVRQDQHIITQQMSHFATFPLPPTVDPRSHCPIQVRVFLNCEIRTAF